MLNKSLLHPLSKEEVNGFRKVNEICLNYVNKDVSYINILGYLSEKDLQEGNYYPSDWSYINVKVDPSEFDNYFSTEVLETSFLFKNIEDYLKSTGIFN